MSGYVGDVVVIDENEAGIVVDSIALAFRASDADSVFIRLGRMTEFFGDFGFSLGVEFVRLSFAFLLF